MKTKPRTLLTLLGWPTCLLLIWAAFAEANLPFSISYPQQCTPLNITWTPTSKGYPYSVFIMAVGGTVQSFTIPSSYQPNADQITFQYNLPPPSSYFPSFVVGISDAQGNGNSSQVLPINTGGDSNSNCGAWAGTAAFTYAGDSQSGQTTDRVQCGYVRFYPVSPPFRGTSPFSLTWVPLGAAPISVSIPQSATQNTSYFIYTSPVPFASGTQVYQFLSDATGGGSGGGSSIYTISSSSNTSCLASDYNLANKITDRTMPLGSSTASFQNLAGAVNASSVSTGSGPASSSGVSGGKSSTGGLVGGIIGAVIGVGAILLLVAIFLIYRRRQKKQVEAARKEAPQFVDLDGDEEDQALNGNRNRRGASQTYHVSPFTYQSTAPHSPGETNNEVMEMYNDSSQYLMDGGRGGSPRPTSINTAFSYNDSQNQAGTRYPPTASSNNLAPTMSSTPYQARGSEADYLSTNSSGTHANSRVTSHHSGNYVLRTRNDSTPRSPTNVPALPNKAAIFGEGAESEPQSSSRRLLQHADGGPLVPNPSSEVEELPPTYGQWTNTNQSQSRSQEGEQQESASSPITNEVTAASPQERQANLW